ncbi:MAG: sigma-70 family RNA polymerase sigma factor [Clostridiaceae bacterium]|nr:sigma-70 family RNA polymerase sigma factor [Clostridiaceae bacterium]
MSLKTKEQTELLVKEHTPLVWSIVRRYMGRGVDPEDLFQLGAIGLIKAIEGFDESYGTQFSTYAVPKIIGEIKRFLRDDGSVKVSRSLKEKAYAIEHARRRLREQLGAEPTVGMLALETGFEIEDIALCEQASMPVASLDEPLREGGGNLLDIKGDDTHEEKMIEYMSLYEAIEKLDEDERKVLALRFFRDLTQQKTAEVLGMSQVKVSRVEKRAIIKVKGFMNDTT